MDSRITTRFPRFSQTAQDFSQDRVQSFQISNDSFKWFKNQVLVFKNFKIDAYTIWNFKKLEFDPRNSRTRYDIATQSQRTQLVIETLGVHGFLHNSRLEQKNFFGT